MRTFRGFLVDKSKIAEFHHKGWTNNHLSQPDYEGVVFSDGKVAVRWLTSYRSTTTWESFEDFSACYGSGYDIQWV